MVSVCCSAGRLPPAGGFALGRRLSSALTSSSRLKILALRFVPRVFPALRPNASPDVVDAVVMARPEFVNAWHARFLSSFLIARLRRSGHSRAPILWWWQFGYQSIRCAPGRVCRDSLTAGSCWFYPARDKRRASHNSHGLVWLPGDAVEGMPAASGKSRCSSTDTATPSRRNTGILVPGIQPEARRFTVGRYGTRHKNDSNLGAGPIGEGKPACIPGQGESGHGLGANYSHWSYAKLSEHTPNVPSPRAMPPSSMRFLISAQ